MSVRAIAAGIVHAVREDGASLTPLLERESERLLSSEIPFLKELCFGTLRHYRSLDAYVTQLLDKPLRRKDRVVHALLMIGCYQLKHLHTPDHAAVSETVAACQALKRDWAGRLVNGVLRQFLRQQEALSRKLSKAQLSEHPDWLRRALKQAWGKDMEAICQNNNSRAPMTLRVNRRCLSRDALLAQLAAQGIAADSCHYAEEGVQLVQPVAVTELPGFSTGQCSVQDEAAQLAAGLLDLAPGQRVLDACAAPGGKSCHILERADVRLLALDNDAQRCERIRDNLARLQLNADVLTADALQTAQWWDGQTFDRILLDAPCSATGVIRRHPDIKLLRTEQDITALSELQEQMLDSLWPCLAPGGLLVYATCSILPAENDYIIKRFLQQTCNAEHQPIDADWGIERPFGRQLLPTDGGHDGFYYACVAKKAAGDN